MRYWNLLTLQIYNFIMHLKDSSSVRREERGFNMKYTYREEYFYGFTEDRISIAHIIVWSLFALFCVVVYFPLTFVFFGVAAIFGIYGYKNASKRYKKAMDRRHKMMHEGYQCIGKVIDAGGGLDSVENRYYDEEDNTWKTMYTRIPNYWVEVEYLDKQNGQIKRFKAEKFGKKTSELIGRRADAYVYDGLVYIDIPTGS